MFWNIVSLAFVMIFVERSILGRVTVMLHFPYLSLQYLLCHRLIETEVFAQWFYSSFSISVPFVKCAEFISQLVPWRVDFDDDLWGYFYSRGTLKSSHWLKLSLLRDLTVLGVCILFTTKTVNVASVYSVKTRHTRSFVSVCFI